MKTLLAFALLTLSFTVEADGHHHGGYGYNYGYNNSWNGFAAGAIIGGIAGSLLAPRPYYPPPVQYYPAAPPPPAYRPVWDAYCGCYINLPVYPY